MKKRLTVGLIGVGGFGAAHVKVLQQLEAESVVQLMCVADPSLERLADTRRMMQARNVRWHTDFRTLLEQEWELDAVAIAAPIHLHMEIACASIARDLFVYLEKPPVPLIQQLNELIERDAHRKVTVGFQLINSSAIKQLKVWRTEGKLGDIQCIRVHGCSPRTVEYYARAPWAGKLVYEGKPVFDGPATNALSHWLHNIMYLAGREMDSFDVPRELEAELYRTKPIESYDTICMRGHLKSGIEFQYAVTHASEKPLPCKLEIVGSKGSAWAVENELAAGSNSGLPISVPSSSVPLLETWREFVRFANGETRRASTHLVDTRGYVLATNAALISSGGIRGRAEPLARDGGRAAAAADIVQGFAPEVRLVAETNAARSGKGARVQVDRIRSLDLGNFPLTADW